MKKINILQILFHFMATWFFIFSFLNFSALYSFKTLEAVNRIGSDIYENHEKYGITAKDIWDFTFATGISSLIAIFVAFVVSIFISIKKKWSVFNSIIVFLIGLFLVRLDLEWSYIKRILYIGKLFTDDLFSIILINGIFLSVVGLFVFFSKHINQLITKQKNYS